MKWWIAFPLILFQFVFYRHAAELNETLGQSPTQQAIVQSFLKNYDKVLVINVTFHIDIRDRPRKHLFYIRFPQSLHRKDLGGWVGQNNSLFRI